VCPGKVMSLISLKNQMERLFGVVARHAKVIVVIGLVLSAASTYYAVRHLTLLSSFAGLTSDESSFNKNYASFVHEFKVQSNILVVAKGPVPHKNEEFLDRLSEVLTGNPYLAKVYYKFDLTPFKAWALAYPDRVTLKKIDTTIRLAKPLFTQIGNQVDLTRFWETVPKLSQQSSSFQGDVSDLSDVKTLIDVMTEKLQGKNELPKFESALKDFEKIEEPQYITLNHGEYALFFAEPLKNAKGEEQTKSSVLSLREAIRKIQPEFPQVEAHLLGEPVLGVDEMETAEHDILWAGAISLILCAAILIAGFGDVRKTGLTVITLFVGIGWSLGYLAVSVKHLNVFTLSLFPMLIGLAIDFSIQFLGRYREEREKGMSPENAARITYFSTGTGLFSAALITSLGFFAIAFTEYKGIAELGIATGGSLILCFISTMTILPALLIAFDHNLVGRTVSRNTRIESYIFSHSGIVLTVALLATLFLGNKARDIRFDHNILHLQAKGTDSVQTELDLINASDKSSLFAVIVADNVKQAQNYINRLHALSTVGNIQSPLPFIPSDQKQKSPLLNQIKEDAADINLIPALKPVDILRLKASFEEVNRLIERTQKKLRLAGETLNLFQALVYPGSQLLQHKSLTSSLANLYLSLDSLHQSASHFLAVIDQTDPSVAASRLTQFQNDIYRQLTKIIDLLKTGAPDHTITLSDLPENIRDQFVGRTGKIMIQVYPAQNIWERPALERFVNELREVDPNVTGSPILIFETTRLMLDSYKQAAKIAFWVIVLVAFLHFRTMKLTFFTLLPLAVGLLWLLGLMVLFHQAFNPANLLTLPVILGIGVAFGVYVVNRYRQEKHPSIFSTSTGRSVLLSALTSVAGFASLLGVRHQGLQSLGFTMTVG